MIVSSYNNHALKCSGFVFWRVRLVAQTFREVHFFWSNSIDYGYITETKPDIVLSELAERFVKRVPDDKRDLRSFALARTAAFTARRDALQLNNGQDSSISPPVVTPVPRPPAQSSAASGTPKLLAGQVPDCFLSYCLSPYHSSRNALAQNLGKIAASILNEDGQSFHRLGINSFAEMALRETLRDGLFFARRVSAKPENVVGQLGDGEPARRSRERSLEVQALLQSGRQLNRHQGIEANIGKRLAAIQILLRKPQDMGDFFDDHADDFLARVF